MEGPQNLSEAWGALEQGRGFTAPGAEGPELGRTESPMGIDPETASLENEDAVRPSKAGYRTERPVMHEITYTCPKETENPLGSDSRTQIKGSQNQQRLAPYVEAECWEHATNEGQTKETESPLGHESGTLRESPRAKETESPLGNEKTNESLGTERTESPNIWETESPQAKEAVCPLVNEEAIESPLGNRWETVSPHTKGAESPRRMSTGLRAP